MKNAAIAKTIRAATATAATVSAPVQSFESFKAIMVKSEDASKTLFGLRQEAAKWLFASNIAKGKPTLERHKVLMAAAKAACAELVIQNRNTWAQISACLLVLLEPKTEIELGNAGKNGKNPVQIIPAGEIKSMDSILKAATQIREAVGGSDGRKNNTPATKNPAPMRASFWVEIETILKTKGDDNKRLLEVLKTYGFIPAPKPRKPKLDVTQLIPAA